jgi:hypothetical protein
MRWEESCDNGVCDSCGLAGRLYYMHPAAGRDHSEEERRVAWEVNHALGLGGPLFAEVCRGCAEAYGPEAAADVRLWLAAWRDEEARTMSREQCLKKLAGC